MIRTLTIVLALASGCALQYVVPDDGTPQCMPDETSCDDICVDADVDPDHCGGCGITCDDDEICVAGDCVESPACTLDACDDECVDTQTDPANCGMCGRWCESSAECIAGACVTTCSDSCDSDAEICVAGVCECREGLMPCDGECVDMTSDDDNCGLCGRECDDMLCNAGECGTSCGAGLSACEDSCVDLDSDPLNCGLCDRGCHPSQACVAGECKSAS
jgi:hypothetical protein